MFNSKIFKATTLYVVGSFFNKSIALLLLPFFTSLLSTESYGIVSTYTSWVNILVIIVGVQFGYTIRSAYTDFSEELDKYIYSINILSLLISFILSISLFCISNSIYGFNIGCLVLCCIVQAFFNGVINIELQKQMMDLAYKERTILLSAPNFLAAIIGIIVLMLWPAVDYYGRIFPMVFIYVIIGGYLFLKYLRNVSIHSMKKYLHYAFSLSLPLIFHGFASVLLSNMDKTMITYFIGASQTGIYSVAYTMGMAVIAVTAALESVWIPWFTRKMNEGKKEFINIIGEVYIYIGSLVCVIAALCLPEVLMLFASRPYWSAVDIISPIVLSSYVIFLFTICANIEYYYKSTKHIAFNTIVACMCNLFLNYMLIPKLGAMGAAYSTLVSYFISFLMHYKYSRKLDSKIFSYRMYVLPISITFIFCIVANYVLDYPLFRWGIAVLITIIFCVKTYLNWKNTKFNLNR